LMLNSARASRLVAQNALDPNLPDLGFLLEKIIEGTWKEPELPGYQGEIKRVVEKLVLQHLINLAANSQASAQAKAIALYQVKELKDWLVERPGSLSPKQKAHNYYCITLIDKLESSPGETVNILSPLRAPDGAPIGQSPQNWLDPICYY